MSGPPATPGRVVTFGMMLLAIAVFFPLFVFRGIGAFDFWWWMAANAGTLILLSAVIDPGWRREIAADLRTRTAWKIAGGLVSAAALYGVFFVGNGLSRVLFGFAGGSIDEVYGFKADASALRIGILMLLLIGPGEELFWRAFLQRRLASHYGAWIGFAAASGVYTLMHAGSLNPMLVLAALIAGAYWGFLYLRFRSVLLNVVSHVAWDLAVFLFAPFH